MNRGSHVLILKENVPAETLFVERVGFEPTYLRSQTVRDKPDSSTPRCVSRYSLTSRGITGPILLHILSDEVDSNHRALTSKVSEINLTPLPPVMLFYTVQPL